MKQRLTFFFCFILLFSARTWGQTWNLTPTMTATLDSAGVLTVSTTLDAEAMPNYFYDGLFNASAPPYRNADIRSVVIKDKVTSIGNNAFGYMMGNGVLSRITSVTIPNSVTSIGYEAFNGSGGLITSVTIPNSVTSIGYGAFYGCGFTSVFIPSSVTYLGEKEGNSPFSGCSTLTSLQVDPDNPVYSSDSEGVLYNKDKTQLLLFPQGKNGAFTIPSSVQTIGQDAFIISSLTSITIPNSVVSVGAGFFVACTALTDVTVNWKIPLTLIPSSAFITVNIKNCVLHVPTGTKSLYQAADIWQDFGTIIDDVASNDTLSVSPDSLNFAASGEQKTFTVTSNTEWAISSNVSWLTVSPVSGANNDTITVTAAANVGTSQRTATLTVSSTDVTAQTISITQNGIPTIPVASVVLNYSAAELIAGETLQLTATVFPSNATNPKVSWSSNNPAVAAVSDSGLITAKLAGAANITVTTEDGNKTATCAVTVKDISVEVPDSTTVAQSGKGTIELSLTIPSDATLTGSFEIQFPEGMTLDEQLTVLSLELSGNFALSFTFEGNNTWLITITSKGLRSSKAVEYRKIMDIAYSVADNVAKGSYNATIKNLDFLLNNGVSIQEKSLTIPITVSGSSTSIDNVRNASFYASVVHKKIKIESPNKELISIYSTKGTLLYSTMKNSGSIEVPVSSLHGSVFIIKGSVSGTVKIRL